MLKMLKSLFYHIFSFFLDRPKTMSNPIRRLIRSMPSNQPSYILFVNGTERPVDIFWIDYQSEPVLYNRSGPILPDGKLAVNTFSTHPWMIRDHRTGERMNIDHAEIFWPPPWFTNIVQQGNQIKRRPVLIHLPLRSLKIIANWTVSCRLQSKEAIDELELPLSLRYEVSQTFLERHKL